MTGYKKIGNKLNISKNEFYDEIVKSKKNNELTPKAVDFFIKMAVHGVRHGNLNYPNSLDEEDCIQSALHDMLKYWRNFDEKLFKDPFSFFTSILFNGFAKQFKSLYKHRFVKHNKDIFIYINDKPDYEYLVSEIDNIFYKIKNIIKIKDIKKIRIRFKNIKSTKWMDITMDNYEYLYDICEYMDYIKTITIRFEYTSGTDFISINQSGDSEIYSI